MRHLLFATVAVVALAGPAAAGNNTCIGNADCSNNNTTNNTTNQGIGVGVGKAKSSSKSSSSASAEQSQGQLQGQLQGQFQGQSNSAVGTGNSTSVSVNEDYDASQMPGYAPDVNVQPSAPCSHVISTTGGFTAGAGVSWGLGFSYDDAECNAREAVRIANTSGSPTIRAAADELTLKLLKRASAGLDKPLAAGQVSSLNGDRLQHLDQSAQEWEFGGDAN